MQLNTLQINTTNNSIDKKVAANIKNTQCLSNFSKVLNQINSFSSQTLAYYMKDPSISSSLNKIEELFSMDITSEYLKKNGQLDILKIINKYEDNFNLSYSNDFIKSLNVLLDKNIVSKADYLEVVKWITLQTKSQNIKEKTSDDILKTMDNIDNISTNTNESKKENII